MDKITPTLWFDGKAEEAARFYTSIFPNSRIVSVDKAPADNPSGPKDMVLTVTFTIDGRSFMGLNGGPDFKFNEAISFQILCDTQREIDNYWTKLSDGGDRQAQQCGWLKDKYGVSWQVATEGIEQIVGDPDDPGSQRAMEAMLKMKKLDIAELKRAYDGRCG